MTIHIKFSKNNLSVPFYWNSFQLGDFHKSLYFLLMVIVTKVKKPGTNRGFTLRHATDRSTPASDTPVRYP